jgi:hypothetical protein
MRFLVYESLYFLNRNIDDLLVVLEEIRKCPGMPERSFEAYKVEIQYLRSRATQDVLEAMNDMEIDEMATLGKQKKDYEDTIRDLDDVYFEVQQREEQRRKQGLPSLIGILPRDYPSPTSASAETDDDQAHSRTPRRTLSPNSIKSQNRNLHGKKHARNSRTARRTERAS